MENTGTGTVAVLKAHLALNVKNVERSIEFYKKMLGIEPSKVRRGYAKFDVQNPPLNLTLNEVAFNERGALSHLGLQVASTDDVLAMRERWGAAGLLTLDEMQTNCCYALQDKTWVNDPDGNEWEAFVVLEDNLRETTMCCVTGEAEQSEAATACLTTPENASKVETASEVKAASEVASCCATANVATVEAESSASVEASSSCCGTAAAAPLSISR